MAEAVAKHLKDFLSDAQPAIQAAIEAAAKAPTPTPLPVAEVAPIPSAVKPVVYQHQDNARIEATVQPKSQLVSGEESLGSTARRVKQQKACLELAKENPSITCN